jgi:uncharacterized beta-barrel protein YwiB (DUF1934 family)
MKNCLMTLKTITIPYEGEPDVIELTSPAHFSVTQNGNYKIKYKETDLAGYDGATTEMLCAGDRARIKRTGSSEMCLSLDLLKKHYSVYKTPYGDLSMGIVTHNIKNNLTENGGDIEFRYSLDVDSKPFTENEISVNIKL